MVHSIISLSKYSRFKTHGYWKDPLKYPHFGPIPPPPPPPPPPPTPHPPQTSQALLQLYHRQDTRLRFKGLIKMTIQSQHNIFPHYGFRGTFDWEPDMDHWLQFKRILLVNNNKNCRSPLCLGLMSLLSWSMDQRERPRNGTDHMELPSVFNNVVHYQDRNQQQVVIEHKDLI